MSSKPAKPTKNRYDERPNTIGIPARQLNTLLDHLDQPEDAKDTVRRQFSRWPFRQATINVTISHPGGSSVTLRLACRNLSKGGIGLLHSSFVHPGSLCKIELPNLSGTRDRIDGVIQRCTHRRGTLHELGVRFRQPIDVSRYMERDQAAWSPSLEKVEPDHLAGMVLYAEPAAADLEHFQASIKETSLRLRHVRTGAEVLSQNVGELCVIVADVKLPDMTGHDLVGRLRAAGVKLPVLLLVTQPTGPCPAPPEPKDPNVVLLQKPVIKELLIRILAEWTLTAPVRKPKAAPPPPKGKPEESPVKQPPKAAAA